MVLGLLFGIAPQSLGDQWPRCNVLDSDLGSSHCCAKTFLEALGRIGQVETGEAALGRFTASTDSRIAKSAQQDRKAFG